MSHNAESDATYSTLAAALTEQRLACYGYQPNEIAVMVTPPDHDAAGCQFDGNSMGWDCCDEWGTSNHPLADEGGATAEFVCWVLAEALTSGVLTFAVTPPVRGES